MSPNGSHSYTVLITPDLAKEWLEAFAYKYQRPITKSTVTKWAREMSEGKWLSGMDLHIAVVEGSGKRYLINGHHRLSAIIVSGCAQQFTVIEHAVKTEDSVHEAYAVMDIQKIRNDMDSMRHLELGETYGFNLRQERALGSAVRVIESRFTQVHHARIATREIPEKVIGWAPYLQKYIQAIGEAPSDISYALKRQAVIGVGMVTMKYCPEKAMPFWNGISQDDEVSVADPRKVVRRWLIANTVKSKSSAGKNLDTHLYSLYLATAWNNWFLDKQIGQLKVYDTRKEVLFEGVPYDYSG